MARSHRPSLRQREGRVMSFGTFFLTMLAVQLALGLVIFHFVGVI